MLTLAGHAAHAVLLLTQGSFFGDFTSFIFTVLPAFQVGPTKQRREEPRGGQECLPGSSSYKSCKLHWLLR